MRAITMFRMPSVFNAPPAAAEARPAGGYIQPSLDHGLRVWWAYYWPTNLIALGAVAVINFALGAVYENTVISGRVVGLVARIQPYLVTYLVSIFTIRYILGKRFRHFRIALVPRTGSETQPLPRTFGRTIRVWWTFVWRTLVYGLIVTFAGTILLGTVTGVLSEFGRVMAILTPIVVGVVIAGVVGLFVMYSNILDEEFGDFRVALLPRETEVSRT
jgi:hypothetical protein